MTITMKGQEDRKPETEKRRTLVHFYTLLFHTWYLSFCSADTKNTLSPDFSTPKNKKFKIFTPKHTNSHFVDTRLRIWHRGQISGIYSLGIYYLISYTINIKLVGGVTCIWYLPLMQNILNVWYLIIYIKLFVGGGM